MVIAGDEQRGAAGPTQSEKPSLFVRLLLSARELLPGAYDGGVQLGSEEALGWQRSEVFRNPDLPLVELQQFNLFFVLGAAKNQAERSLLVVGATLILIEPPQVEFHLPFVTGFEAAEF